MKKYKSVRPDADQYTEDFQSHENIDFEEEFNKTPDSDEYGNVKNSFKTMAEANSKFKPMEGVVPDASGNF